MPLEDILGQLCHGFVGAFVFDPAGSGRNDSLGHEFSKSILGCGHARQKTETAGTEDLNPKDIRYRRRASALVRFDSALPGEQTSGDRGIEGAAWVSLGESASDSPTA